MKSFFLYLITSLTALTTFAQNRVTFKISSSALYNTYDFLGKLSENYPDNDLKTAFLKSKYNTPTYVNQLAQFDNLRLDYTYAYNQYPTLLKVGLMSRDLLERNLALSKTMIDFKNRSLGLIPTEDLSAFANIIENFAPIYQELIFKLHQTEFNQQENNLKVYIKNNRFADFFAIGLNFYNTKWDPAIPFELCLLPSLEKNNLGARAFMNVAICEAALNLKDHKTLFSVAMHEIYHIIYDNQSLDTKINLQAWFNHTSSKNSQYALLLMNEVLATALGNGYIMEQLNGKIDEQDWYANKYITAMAKEIYPLVKDYINKKLPIDENFVKAYVAKYDTKFPHWNKELDHLLAYRYILSDNVSDLSYFRKNYRKYSNNRMGSPISVAELEKMKDYPITKVFVVTKNHEQTLQLIKANFEELKEMKFDAATEFVKVMELTDRTKLILINRHQSTVESLMNATFPEKIIQ